MRFLDLLDYLEASQLQLPFRPSHLLATLQSPRSSIALMSDRLRLGITCFAWILFGFHRKCASSLSLSPKGCCTLRRKFTGWWRNSLILPLTKNKKKISACKIMLGNSSKNLCSQTPRAYGYTATFTLSSSSSRRRWRNNSVITLSPTNKQPSSSVQQYNA